MNFHGIKITSPYPKHAMDKDGWIVGYTHPPKCNPQEGEWERKFGVCKAIMKIDPASISVSWESSLC